MKRPVERMLEPSSMHDYCAMARRYGFYHIAHDASFDPQSFYIEWKLKTKDAKDRCVYSNISTLFPDLTISKTTDHIRIYTGADAVYTAVDLLSPVLSDLFHGYVDFPPYSPMWGDLGQIYAKPEKGMRSYTVHEVVYFLEWIQKVFFYSLCW